MQICWYFNLLEFSVYSNLEVKLSTFFCASKNKNTCFNLWKFDINELHRVLGINKAVGWMVDILIMWQLQEIFPNQFWSWPSLLLSAYWDSFPWAKVAGVWGWPLKPYSSEVKNECSSTPSTFRLCVTSFVLSVLFNGPLNVYASIYNRCVLFPFHLSWWSAAHSIHCPGTS